MSDRDPRIDPRPGDVLKAPATEMRLPRPHYRVVWWTAFCVALQRDGLREKEFTVMMDWYRWWAAKTTVVERGPS